MYYPQEVIDEVTQRSDIVDIISGYISLKRAGNTYKGLCPFHNEKTPSFHVNQSGQYFHCFGCGKGGNVITFVREYENYSFTEAIKFLADKAGMQLPEVEFTEEERKRQNLKSQLYEVNKSAAGYFYYQLRNKAGELGMNYFKSRQLSDETMHKFGLGYSLQYTDDLYKYLKGKDYSDYVLNKSGLFTFNEKYGVRDKFINRVMFPITDINHKVIAFGGRVMGDGEPKYLNSPETDLFSKSNNLYALDIARTSRKDQIIMCEGYMDVIAMHQAGFTEASASLGTAFTMGHAMLLKRYTKNILLAYDSDKAGVNAALKNIAILREAGLHARIINMEPYKDPDEFIKNLGAEEFQKRIDEAENGFMYEVRQSSKNYNLGDPDGQTDFYNDIATKLCVFTEEVERNNYLEAVCRQYNISNDSMKKLVNSKSLKLINAPEKRSPVEVKSGKKDNSPEENANRLQRVLLTYLVEDKSLYKRIKDLLTEDDFTDELYKKVAHNMLNQLSEDKLDPGGIINLFEDVEDQSKVALIFNTKVEGLETEAEKSKAFRDAVIAVKRNAFNHYSRQLGTDQEALKKVIAAKQSLEKLEKSNL